MQTLEVIVPDDKTLLIKKLLKELGATVKVKKTDAVEKTKSNVNNIHNAETILAMEELKAGMGKKFRSVEELFNAI